MGPLLDLGAIFGYENKDFHKDFDAGCSRAHRAGGPRRSARNNSSGHRTNSCLHRCCDATHNRHDSQQQFNSSTRRNFGAWRSGWATLSGGPDGRPAQTWNHYRRTTHARPYAGNSDANSRSDDGDWYSQFSGDHDAAINRHRHRWNNDGNGSRWSYQRERRWRQKPGDCDRWKWHNLGCHSFAQQCYRDGRDRGHFDKFGRRRH
jgi:hypothetical protein